MKPAIYSFSVWLLLLALCCACPATAQAPPNNLPTLAQATAANPALADVLQKAGMMPLLSNKGPYTFFVPSATALQQLAQMDPTAMRQVLMSHLVEGRYTAADLHDGAVLTTLSRQTIKVCRKKDKLMLNGIVVNTPDQPVANGIMHTVNGLMGSEKTQASLL